MHDAAAGARRVTAKIADVSFLSTLWIFCHFAEVLTKIMW